MSILSFSYGRTIEYIERMPSSSSALGDCPPLETLGKRPCPNCKHQGKAIDNDDNNEERNGKVPNISNKLFETIALSMGVKALVYPLDYSKNVYFAEYPLSSRGFRGGFIPSTLIGIPQAAVTLAVKKTLDKNSSENRGELESFQNSFAAGAVSGACTAPVEMISLIRQCASRRTTSGQVVSQVISYRGVLGLFSGSFPLSLREGCFASSYLYFGPRLGIWFRCLGLENKKSEVAGTATAGALSALLTTPFDFHRVQLQKNGHQAPRTILIKELFKLKISSMVKGAVPRTISSAFGAVILFFGSKYFLKQS